MGSSRVQGTSRFRARESITKLCSRPFASTTPNRKSFGIMTRYTNVGRKCKYLESEKEIADKDAAKKSRLVEDEGQTTLASTSKAAESSEIKNAYKNRDKIRKSSF